MAGRNLLARKPVATLHVAMGTTTITLAAYVQIIAAILVASDALEVTNTGTSMLKLALGAAGQEVDIPYTIAPGASRVLLPFTLPKGSRLSARAVDADSSAGDFILNTFG